MILAAHVIEHLADPAAGLARLAGWLAPGGSLLLVASRPHWCQWPIWLRWRHRWFAPDAVAAMADAAGLRLAALHRFPAGPASRTSLGYHLTIGERSC